MHDLTIHSVSSLPSSVMVHSRIQQIHQVRALACKFRIHSFNLNIRYMVGRTGHTYTYVHATCNAVSLVWGSLRLAPTKLRLVIRLLTIEGKDA